MPSRPPALTASATRQNKTKLSFGPDIRYGRMAAEGHKMHIDMPIGDLAKITVTVSLRMPRHHRPASVQFGVPRLRDASNPAKGYFPMSLTLPNDAVATVPLIGRDLVGKVIPADTANVAVSVSDPAVAEAAIAADGQSVIITPLAATGTGTVTYTDTSDPARTVTATLDFSIVTPDQVEVMFNEAGATFAAKP